MSHQEHEAQTTVPWSIVAGHLYTPAYLLFGGTVIAGLDQDFTMKVLITGIWLYVVPPLLCRTTLLLFRPQLVIKGAQSSSRPFKVWWWLTQVQMIFNRVTVLEDLLRLIPGAYSLWLKCWGSNVSLSAFWSPGVLVLDRYLLHIGKNVVLGTNSLLTSHIVERNKTGDYVLTVAPLEIGDRATLGALAAIGPGCRIASDETVPLGRILPPFSFWKGGRKERINHDPVAEAEME